MIEGTKTYTFPNSDAEITVTYRILNGEVVFIAADVGDRELDCDLIGVHIEEWGKNDLMKKTRYCSLKSYLQSKLDEDSERIFDYHDLTRGPDYDEHYPAGLL